MQWREVSRALRVAHGLAQEDWAAWLEVSRKTVQRWERGEAVPNGRAEERLVAFCEEKDVFARRLDVGVTSAAELRDVLAAARTAHQAVPATALVGRGPDLSALRDLLARHRCVTIVGPGGVGKTSLALEAAGPSATVVRLETVADPDLVLGAVADALGLRPGREASIRARLARHLDDRPTLVVLDNFEHLLSAAPIVDDLLASCRDLRVLVTSRAPLGITGEHVLPIAPLDPEAAVDLFVQRARQAGVGPEDVETVRAVCRRLDRLPLAIELAAARLRHISLDDLADRLDHALRLLGRSRGAPAERHRSMVATIGWSVDLLTESERELFLRLSPFVDGADLAAVEAVGGPDAIDDLGSLIDHSIVSRDRSRYRMLETVREYARLLAADAPEQVDEPFHSWARRFARAHDEELRGAAYPTALDALGREYANLRAALSALTAAQDPRAAGLAVSLCGFWDARSMLAEARRFLEPLIAPSDVIDRATVRIWSAYFAALQGDLATAARLAGQGRQTFSEAGVDAGVGYAELISGFVAAEQGRLGEAQRCFEASERSLHLAGDEWGVIRPINNLGELHRATGDLDEAERRHVDALRRCRELGEVGSLPAVLSSLAQVHQDRGDAAAAREAAEEALEAATASDNLVGQATALEALGRAAFETGDDLLAVERWAKASAARDRVGLPIEARDRTRHERQLDELRARIGPSFEECWARGREP